MNLVYCFKMYRIFENTAVIRPFSISKLPFLVCFQLWHIFYMHVDKWNVPLCVCCTHQSFLRLLLGLGGGLHGRVNPESHLSVLLWRLHICQEEDTPCWHKRTLQQRCSISFTSKLVCSSCVFRSRLNTLRLKIYLQAAIFCLEIELNFSKRTP